jgi:formylglycine-generating enzyme required for sulfatase activity
MRRLLILLACSGLALNAQAAGRLLSDPLPGGAQGPALVVVPAGRFLLGDSTGRGNHNERPPQQIEIKQPFAIGRYEISFADWRLYAEATHSAMPDNEGWGLSAERRQPRLLLVGRAAR